ncbi:MAG: phosphomethylpyrimidine kinase [Daejeonella sp.]|nr:phosphomethylpyrimidine kinase [Daejeonella sp.]
MSKLKYVSVLSIAGSDSSAGAGIQADLKTFSALGCYGTTAITAITCQNTLGVSDIHAVPAEIVYQQIKSVLEDIRPSAIKIGMIPNSGVASAIADILKVYQEIPVVYDPVMISSSGKRLMNDEALEVIRKQLFPITYLLTPNLLEAAFLSGLQVSNVEEMTNAAKIILDSNCPAVLVKGGHLIGDDLYDVLVDSKGHEQQFSSKFIQSNNTHGTGCTLSSAIAAYLGLGLQLHDAVTEAKKYVHEAILAGTDVKTGKGTGPLNHFFDSKRMVKVKH